MPISAIPNSSNVAGSGVASTKVLSTAVVSLAIKVKLLLTTTSEVAPTFQLAVVLPPG